MNLLVAVVLSMFPHFTPAAPSPVSPAAPEARAKAAIDPALDLMGRLVGGKWVTEGSFVAEFTYEWRVKGKAIRGVGVIAKGTPQEIPAESLYGWDEANKSVYYVDFHGHDTVYKGSARVENGKFVGEFECIVGPKGVYRFEDELTDDDTLVGTLFGKQGDKWIKLHSLTFKRHREGVANGSPSRSYPTKS